jgi:N-sulfoglucosamine sulfohydrolase
MNLWKVLGTTLLALAAGSAAAAPKNVLLIVADDHSPDAGCYGNPVLKTPNLDRLAAEGTRFPFAFCTTASCSASRSVILTGLHNHANGQYGHQHAIHHFSTFDTVKSLPVRLSEAGYRTARVGKFHVAPEAAYRFDTLLHADGRNPVAMADACKDFLAAPSSRPFFLYFCTDDPHRGGGIARELPGQPDRFGNRPQGYPGVQTVRYDPKDVIVPPFLPDIPECRAELAQYYQAVTRIDQGIGRLMQLLRETGRWDDTLVLYISDHGIAFPGAKTTTYDPGLRVPCIVRSPYSKRRGIACRAMVSWVDLTPTILEFASVSATRLPVHGRSFLGILEQADPAGWDEIHFSHTFHEVTMYYPMRGVRTRNHKLIFNVAHPLPFPFASDLWASATWQGVLRQGPNATYGKRRVEAYIHRPRFELYDMINDPDEVKNLAADAANAPVLQELKAKVQAFQKRTRDPWLLKWDRE